MSCWESHWQRGLKRVYILRSEVLCVVVLQALFKKKGYIETILYCTLINIPLPRTELLHNIVSFFLWHVSMHRANSEICLLHFLCQPVHLPLGVAENNCLSYSKSVIKIAKCVKLPLLTFYCYEELLYSFQRQFVTESTLLN